MFYQTYGSSATACVSGDWFGEVREVDLADLKQEPDDVHMLCSLSYVILGKLPLIEVGQTALA